MIISRKRIVLILLLLAAARLLLAAFTSVFDPSEGRYAALCANMASSGDFIVPRFIHDGVFQSFDGKPPLLFQLGGLSVKLFGRTELAVRLPSLLAAFGTLTILFLTLRRRTDSDTAWLGTAMAATSVAFFAAAGFCMTDMLLTFAVGGALLLEDLFNRAPDKRLSLAIFALLGLGMLIKGPVALMLFGLPVFLDAWVNRRWPTVLRHAWVGGPLLFLAIAAPWYVLMERRTPGFLSYFFIHENLLRFLVHDYGDRYGAGRETFRGMAAIWTAVATLPWTPLAALNLKRERPGLLALGILSITAFWCLTSRVPFPYLLPVVPIFFAWLAPRLHDTRLPLRLLPAAGVICVIIHLATCLITTYGGTKMPGRLFTGLRATYPDRGFHFPKHQPYSAEFYFGDRLHLKPQPGDVIIHREKHAWRVVP